MRRARRDGRRDAQRVLCPHRGRTRRHRRRDRHVGKALVVAPRNSIAGDNFVGKYFQLLDQDRGLHGVEPRCQANPNIVVFIAAVTVHAQAAHHVGQFCVVCHHRATVAIAAERFCRKETGRGGVPTKAATSAVAQNVNDGHSTASPVQSTSQGAWGSLRRRLFRWICSGSLPITPRLPPPPRRQACIFLTTPRKVLVRPLITAGSAVSATPPRPVSFRQNRSAAMATVAR